MLFATFRSPSFASTLRLGCVLAAAALGSVAPAQTGSFSAQSVNLGSVAVNTGTPATATLTFTFATGGDIAAPSVVTQGAKNLDFTDAGTGTCTTNGTSHSYSAGQTCTVTVNFVPKFAGTRNGAVVLYDSSDAPIATAYIYGMGNGPEIIFTPSPEVALGGGLQSPNGVAIDGSGNVYVAGGGTVKEIPPGCTSAACVITIGGTLINPSGVAVSGNGTVYVVSRNGSVKGIPAGCATSSCVTTLGGSGTFIVPVGVAVDGSGNVYVVDDGNDTVSKMRPTCASSTCVNPLGGNYYSYPQGVAVDASGNVYVTNFDRSTGGAVTEMPPGCASSSCVTTLGGSGTFIAPVGVAVDGSGNVYVTDGGANRDAVMEMPPGCASSSCVTSLVSGIEYPYGVVIDGGRNVYFTAAYTGWVEELDREGGPSLNFGATEEGQTSPDSPQTVTIENVGNEPLAFPIPSFGSNPDISANFSLDSSGANACPLVESGASSAGTLAVGASCDLPISFTPGGGVFGPQNGSVVLTDNSSNGMSTGYAQQTIALSGTVLSATPPPVNFGSASVNTNTPVAIAVTLTVPLNGTIGAPAVLTQGAANLDFTDAGTGTCTTNGTGHTYSAGDTCTVNVNFKPRFAGARYGAVVLSNSSNVAIVTEYIYGTGIGPQVVFGPQPPAVRVGGFDEPNSVAADSSGNFYIADSLHDAVREVPAGCTSSSCVMTLGGIFADPQGIALDGSGNIYVANAYYSDPSVQEMPPGCASSSCVVTLGGGFKFPDGVAVDRSGNVYVADTGNDAVKEIPPGCTSSDCVVTLAGGFGLPLGVAVDGSGNVYVADSGDYRVKKIGAGCTASSCVSTVGGGSLSPYAPIAVAVDGSGNVYIASAPVNSAGGIVTEARAGCASPSCVLQLNDSKWGISGLLVSGNGNLYAVAVGGNLLELDRADAPSLTFAPAADGKTSADSPQTVPVQNIGNAPLRFPIPSSGNNPGISANFSLPGSGTSACPLVSSGAGSAGTLAVGALCDLAVSFTPGSATYGNITGSLALTDNTLNAPAPGYATQTIALSGIANPPIGTINKVIDATTHSATVAQADNLLVTGWAADPHDGAPVSRVAVLIDGKAVGNATLGIARPDVVALYNNFSYYSSGWTFPWPASGLSVGKHTVSAVAYDSLGLSTQFPALPANFQVSATTASASPVGALNVAIDATTHSTTVSTTDNLLVAGWAADLAQGAPVSSVAIFVDGKAAGAATLGIARPDVASAQNNPAWLNSGWSFTESAAGLALGTHTVTAVAVDSLGNSRTFGPATITVSTTKTPGPPFGSLDKAVDATTGLSTVSQSDNLLVSGWAADFHDGAPVHQVSVEIDGVAVGNATLGWARPDVAATLHDAAYTNSGWTFTTPASGLAAGTHTVTAVATDSLGVSTQLQIVLITVSP